MKFVLILVWALGGTTESGAVAMHEFDSLDACENAGKVFMTMVSKKTLINRADWSCVEKAFAAKK